MELLEDGFHGWHHARGGCKWFILNHFKHFQWYPDDGKKSSFNGWTRWSESFSSFDDFHDSVCRWRQAWKGFPNFGVRNQDGKVWSRIKTREKCCKKERNPKNLHLRDPEGAAALQKKILGTRVDHKLNISWFKRKGNIPKAESFWEIREQDGAENRLGSRKHGNHHGNIKHDLERSKIQCWR